MLVDDFDVYRLTQAEVNDLSELSGAVVAIEAGFFLRRLLENVGIPYEALVPATGGIPYHLRSYIEDDLDKFKNADIEALFVFDGLDAGKKFTPFSASNTAVDKCRQAWEKYEQGQSSEDTLNLFKQTGAIKVESVYGLLQIILKERNIAFKVAPYNAVAQIAYLYQHGNDFIDAVAGPADLLLYDVDRVIINLNMQQDRFSFIDRSAWMQSLSTTSSEQFVDACMLTGTTFCRQMPALDKQPRRLQEFVNLLRMNNETGYGLCRSVEGTPPMNDSDYVDRYRRARLRVKHSVVLTTDGTVEPLDKDNAPMDLHDIVGQQLPDELYYYMSMGAIGSRLLNKISSIEIYERIPLDGGISDEYRSLVSDKLMPLKQMTIVLLSKWMHRFFQYREYVFRFWYDEAKQVTFKPSASDLGTPDEVVKDWKVSLATLGSSEDFARRPSLAFAVQSLADVSFAAKTLEGKKNKSVLESQVIIPNIFWRFLHLRGYVDGNHVLTPWGNVLKAILDNINMELTTELEDAALLAVELLRLNLLTSVDYWPNYSRQLEGEGYQDKLNRTLVARVASLLYLSHAPEGYSGRTSRRLLGYNRMITALQSSLRDLFEACFATLLLNGDTERDSATTDLTAIGQALPLNTPLNTTLGVVVYHYLEQVNSVPDTYLKSSTDQEERKQKWKHHLKNEKEPDALIGALDVPGDLEKSWAFWDVVRAGVKTASESGLLKDKTLEEWTAVNEWLASRR